MVCDGWQECMALVPRMLRVWQAARCCDENPLPQMHARTAPFAVTPEFVPACDSLFALTEAVLRRKLIPARSCSARAGGTIAVVAVPEYLDAFANGTPALCSCHTPTLAIANPARLVCPAFRVVACKCGGPDRRSFLLERRVPALPGHGRIR